MASPEEQSWQNHLDTRFDQLERLIEVRLDSLKSEFVAGDRELSQAIATQSQMHQMTLTTINRLENNQITQGQEIRTLRESLIRYETLASKIESLEGKATWFSRALMTSVLFPVLVAFLVAMMLNSK